MILNRLLVGIAAVILVVISGACVTRTNQPATKARSNSPENKNPIQLATMSAREYQSIAAGDGTTKEGFRFAISGLESSDGMKFSRLTVYFDMPTVGRRGLTKIEQEKRAREELEKQLQITVEIVWREPLFDRAGLLVGEKVIAKFPPRYKEFGGSTLLWRRGSSYGYVASSSLENVLAYERDVFSQP